MSASPPSEREVLRVREPERIEDRSIDGEDIPRGRDDGETYLILEKKRILSGFGRLGHSALISLVH